MRHSNLLVPAALFAAAVIVVGCSSSDSTDYGGVGGSNAGGSAGKGGTAGKGGSSGQAGTGGASGQGGTAGKGGAAGKGGTAGTGTGGTSTGGTAGTGTGGTAGTGTGGTGEGGTAGTGTGGTGEGGTAGTGTGGTSTGGTAGTGTGGTSTGGTAGTGTGGTSTGGTAGTGTGGTSTGGTAGTGTGGTSTGGTAGMGGTSTGGTAGTGTGGTSTGGTAGTGGTSTGGTAGTAGTGGTGGCTVLTPGSFSPLSGYTIITAPFTPNLGASDADDIEVSLWQVGSYVQAPGTFDLSVAPETDYETCNHCVIVAQDFGAASPTYFFQQSGSMTVTQVTSPPTNEFAGSLTNVKAIEVTMDSNGHTTPVANGACVLIPSATFNTIVVGTPCQNADTCGDTTANVCDPKLATCQHFGCDTTTACTIATDVCMGQVDNATVGACYQGCTPFAANTCGATGQCVPVGSSLAEGACFRLGTGLADGACNPPETDIGTGCIAGYTCVTENSVASCHQICNYWDANPPCNNSAHDCLFTGICAVATGDPAVIGAACSGGGTEEGDYCGFQGNAWRGMCYDAVGSTAGTCTKMCRVGGTDCTGGLTCTAFQSPYDELGLCL